MAEIHSQRSRVSRPIVLYEQNGRLLELTRRLLKDILNIEARYSAQKAYIASDGCRRKAQYHLRIYRKEYVREFLENISTTKLGHEKIQYVKDWLNHKDKKEIITLSPSKNSH